jgi:hypothetical protein
LPVPGSPLGSFLARFAFALLVAGATYNPTRYSYYAWAKSTGFEWRPPTVFVGVILLIGWVVCLRLTLRSIGGLGLLPANAFLAAFFWLVTSGLVTDGCDGRRTGSPKGGAQHPRQFPHEALLSRMSQDALLLDRKFIAPLQKCCRNKIAAMRKRTGLLLLHQ